MTDLALSGAKEHRLTQRDRGPVAGLQPYAASDLDRALERGFADVDARLDISTPFLAGGLFSDGRQQYRQVQRRRAVVSVLDHCAEQRIASVDGQPAVLDGQ